jgi:hypothetical protein
LLDFVFAAEKNQIRGSIRKGWNNMLHTFLLYIDNKHVPVVMIADLRAAGLQSGWIALRRPTMPET